MSSSFGLRLARVLVLAAFVGPGTIPARAQDAPPPPAYIASVEGRVTLVHDGLAEPALPNTPLVGGDRLYTGEGRARIVFPDGTSLDVDDQSEVDFQSPTRFRVVAGAVERQPAPRVSAPSPYLPENLQTYAPTLDENGTWEYDAPYGYVWYPNVDAEWRPYFAGSWADLQPYGWTWIGAGGWSWPTHHYGRWGYARSRWFWIPGRTWGPAYVSWGVASDYVSWCPLGANNAPLFTLALGVRGRSPGWVVVPRSSFGVRGELASRHAIQPWRVARSTPFIEQRTLRIAAHRERPTAAAGLAPATRTAAGARPAAALSVRRAEPSHRNAATAPRTSAPPAQAGGVRPSSPNVIVHRGTPSAAPVQTRRPAATFVPMGDFRRPQPDPGADIRRPVQASKPSIAAPAPPPAPPASLPAPGPAIVPPPNPALTPLARPSPPQPPAPPQPRAGHGPGAVPHGPASSAPSGRGRGGR
ncbi:MAG TPA: DUF6600 domain-containing protein [Vicinamibacterales bacterium]|nr:DUF6600 domain-containing protein [Vicinamibacterales bacterium]